jgi:hypothetical protein
MRNAHKIFVRKHEGKRLCRKSRCRWKDNIMMHLTEIGLEGVVRMPLAQGRGHW